MFKKLFSFIFDDDRLAYEERISELMSEISLMNDEIIDLEQQVTPHTDENSFVTFYIDNDLKISVNSKVNKEIAPALIDNDVIIAEEAENIDVLQMALVVIANESSEQLILGVNDNDN